MARPKPTLMASLKPLEIIPGSLPARLSAPRTPGARDHITLWVHTERRSSVFSGPGAPLRSGALQMCTHPQIFQHLKGHRLGPSLVTWHRGQTHPTYSRPHGRGLGGQAHGGTCTDDNDQSAQPRSAGRMGRKAEDDMSPRRHSPTLPNHHKEARFSHLGLPMLESPLHTMTRGPRNTERAGRSQARRTGRPKRQAPAQHARPSPARRAPSPGRRRSRGGARPAARTAASSRDSPVILGSRARLSEFKNISSHSGKSARPWRSPPLLQARSASRAFLGDSGHG